MPIFLFHFQEGIFEIDGLNGKITLKKPLDFEGSSSYYFLNITATVRTYLVISYVRCPVYLAFASLLTSTNISNKGRAYSEVRMNTTVILVDNGIPTQIDLKMTGLTFFSAARIFESFAVNLHLTKCLTSS